MAKALTEYILPRKRSPTPFDSSAILLEDKKDESGNGASSSAKQGTNVKASFVKAKDGSISELSKKLLGQAVWSLTLLFLDFSWTTRSILICRRAFILNLGSTNWRAFILKLGSTKSVRVWDNPEVIFVPVREREVLMNIVAGVVIQIDASTDSLMGYHNQTRYIHVLAHMLAFRPPKFLDLGVYGTAPGILDAAICPPPLDSSYFRRDLT
ncbi:hypothetical protein CPB84DRAFT_1744399 [Gymnopilus junonius]|uniref:Uncharacterized protein n=1 Tax=Gymnopilus junonius TaxID=109634 RepID=A0A9P5NWJ3_GYMJU|nr:hypothetical protein CPB84DRAFT_1744399 [Gymnopilus junonius]